MSSRSCPATIPSPRAGRLAPRAVPGARLRALHPAGIVVAVWIDAGAARRARRRAGQVARHRGLGRAVRHRRRPALPRVTTPARTSAPAATRSSALYIWEGGLGIWGARRARRRRRLDRLPPHRASGFPPFADALAPGLLLAQAIGRLGNWFNQELYGRPTDAAVGPADRPGHRRARRPADGRPSGTLFHPTFLYECLGPRGRRAARSGSTGGSRLGHGPRLRALPRLYTTGRLWIELLRIDPANHFLGLRLNVWTASSSSASAPSSSSSRSGSGRAASARPVPPGT